MGSWDSIVSLADGHRLDNKKVEVQVLLESRIFSSPCYLDQFWGPASYPMGTGGSSTGKKRLEREADHSPPTSAKVKKMCISFTSPYAFMAQCLIS
jgi:hypothetical protein